MRPSVDIGQPAERSETGVHDVEATGAERVDRAVQLALDVLDRRVAIGGELRGYRQRRCGEVEALTLRAPSRESDSVSVPM